MKARLVRLLESRYAAHVAAAISLSLGLIFVFVWAPHPWGWRGIDQYHELARGLARGEPFATTDVPWGYAYFVAFFYWCFGERAWVPVTAQVIANASIPFMLYSLVRPMLPQRIAALATLLVGVLSFNTIYASTLSSDSICTVLFIASLLSFARGHTRQSATLFAISGLLAGTVPQFRPNMILIPAVMATVYVMLFWRSGRHRALTHMATFLVLVAVALSPWVVRNYRLTGAILPTSTHGGVQLWYGTLQVGPYLESRAHNPRSIFETASFDYTSMAGQPIIVTVERQACWAQDNATVHIVYWTDRSDEKIPLAPRNITGQHLVFELPGQPQPTTLYYFFEVRWRDQASGEARVQLTPPDAAAAPYVFHVSGDHLGDMDRHGDLLDVFDVVRLVRHLAWQEPLSPTPADFDGDGRTAESDLQTVVVRLLGDRATAATYRGLRVNDQEAIVELVDGSTLGIGRAAGPRITDLDVRGTLAGSLISGRRRLHADSAPLPRTLESCRLVWNAGVNDVFYRREPHLMARYMALAVDNITREPLAFLAASAYRMGRLFVIRGTDDVSTTQQFEGSRFVYTVALILSAMYVSVFLAGAAIGWRRYPHVRLLLIPVVYVPVTICFVLTNMRYTVTVQPLMFVFVAIALATFLRLGPNGEAPRPTNGASA